MPSQPENDSTLDSLRDAVRAVLPDIISFRHELHAHPELSGSEERTARRVSDLLTLSGIAHETGVGGTHAIVGVIECGAGANGPTIALRGDMDALPIAEENDVAYRSENPGVMHACGHDGHTANLLGVTRVLHALRTELPPGRIKFVFQPAEETVRGADALVDAGVVDDVDAIVMLHGWPSIHIPAGKIGVRNGPVMASADMFTVTIHGKGGHGAYPHDTIDPIACGAQIVSALQMIVSREIPPLAPAVISVGSFHAGTASNIIPGTAELTATVRALDRAVRQSMPERIERVIAGVCAALRCTYTFAYSYGTPVTVNDARVSDVIRAAGTAVLGGENVFELPEPTMGAEDFAWYLEKVPGAMFRLGTGCPYALHTPRYDFGDAALEPGVLVMAETARRFLAQGGLGVSPAATA